MALSSGFHGGAQEVRCNSTVLLRTKTLKILRLPQHTSESEAKLITQYKPDNTSRRFADDDMLRETGICTITEEMDHFSSVFSFEVVTLLSVLS